MSEPVDRRTLLKSLVTLAGDVEATLESLRTSGVAEPVRTLGQFDRTHVRHGVEAFLSGEVSADLLERWAEAVHSAEDVALDPSDEAFLADALFQLSTPELFGSMEAIVAAISERDRAS
ncbi:hypothetical protein ACF3NT_11555 [Naumannella halotolerans]|uniref:hypothetical protein n=1 Tax=Naumannella halotolerans TaxID=993414 RepID=UPI00370D76CB